MISIACFTDAVLEMDICAVLRPIATVLYYEVQRTLCPTVFALHSALNPFSKEH